jgi:D-3-phosphoglycerate dehydrogenase / 2-oxoglutarate reductase
MKKILFLDSLHPFLQEELQKSGFSITYDFSSSHSDLLNIIHEFHGIVIRSRFKITREIIDKAVNLEFIARGGAGMENIDVTYAESKGIKCIHAPEGNRDAVGEQAIAMLLMLFNNLKKADTETREGVWIREGNRGIELMGKTVGIFGYGNTGGAFARKLSGFDVKVLAYDKYKYSFSDDFVIESSPEQIFQEADIVSFHLPLTQETRYLADDNFFKSFKKSVYLINTSRGPIVKTDDLVKNMKTSKVLGACLDVLEYEAVSFEKLDRDKLPDSFFWLADSDKVILTPHIAGWTHESNYKIAHVLFSKIAALNTNKII